jgi:hypothetical protein
VFSVRRDGRVDLRSEKIVRRASITKSLTNAISRTMESALCVELEVRPKEPAAVSVSIVPQELTPSCGQPKFQSTNFALESLAIKRGNPLFRHSHKSYSIKGRVGER